MTETATTETSDSNERQEQIDAFEAAFGDSEGDAVGGVTDSSSVIALVFDRDEWGIIPEGLVEDTRHPAVEIEAYNDESVTLTSESGSRVLLTMEYLIGVQKMTGYDLWNEPEHILMNDSDEFPVIIHDPKSDGEIILAPRIAPKNW
jgi:hypothetical protein